jgi:hypothetical protein
MADVSDAELAFFQTNGAVDGVETTSTLNNSTFSGANLSSNDNSTIDNSPLYYHGFDSILGQQQANEMSMVMMKRGIEFKANVHKSVRL